MRSGVLVLARCAVPLIAGLVAVAPRAAAATMVVAPSKDNTLIESPVGNSNGQGDGIYVGRVGALGGGTRRRGVVAFDLSAIPAGSTIDAVTLTLQMAQTNDLSSRVVEMHRLSADWGEAASVGGGSGGPAMPGDATWLFRFFSSTAWTSAGGDFVATASASQTVGGVGAYSWAGAGLVADVQFWLDHPGTNFGWLLRDPETTTTTSRKYYSREGFTPPQLSVTYTPTGAGVEPAGGVNAVSFAAPWPSPGSNRVHLGYTLPRAARVSLAIHDVTGRLVGRLLDGADQEPGEHGLVWDGRTDAGVPAAPGIYLAVLVVEGVAYQRRIALVH